MSRESDASRILVITFTLRPVILKVLVLLMVTWTETFSHVSPFLEKTTIDEAVKTFGELPQRASIFLQCSSRVFMDAQLQQDEDDDHWKKCQEQRGEFKLSRDTSEGVCGGSYQLDVDAEVKMTFPSINHTCDMMFKVVQKATLTLSCSRFALSPFKKEYLYVTSGDSFGRIYFTDKKPKKMEGIAQLYLLYNRDQEQAPKESRVECFVKATTMKDRKKKGKRGARGRFFNAKGQQASNCSSKCGMSHRFSGPTRIVGGMEATEGKYPWVVAVYGLTTIQKNGNMVSFSPTLCGGSIITNKIVLSAAHCVENQNRYIKVVAGLKKVKPNTLQFHFAEWLLHPGYSNIPLRNDVALLILKQELKWTKNVQPICLAPQRDREGDMGIVAGWGIKDRVFRGESLVGKETSQTLREVAVEIVNHENCKKVYINSTDLQISENNLCAASHGKDSCKGDSGGPLMVLEKGIWYQTGIVSGGYGCADPRFPGVYTKVAPYVPWILSHISGSC